MFTINGNFTEDRYKAIIENMVDGFAYCKLIFDENGMPIDFMYIDINQSYERLTGLKREQVLNRKLSEIMPDIDDIDPNWAYSAMQAALKGENTKYDTYVRPFKKWFSCSFFSYEYGYFAEIFHDITSEKQLTEELKKSEEKYKNIFNSVHDSIFIVADETGDIIDANPSACKLYGYTKEEIIKTNRKDFVVDHKNMYENIENNLEHLSLYQKKKDGTIFPTDTCISKGIYNQKNTRIIVVRDLTNHKLVEGLKKEIEQKLIIINESKIYESLRTEFFANISHELRTPLNVILSSLQLVNLYLNNNGSEMDINNLKKYPKIIQQNCFRLLRLVNNLIDITKIDAGYFELCLENRNIISIIEDITLSVADYIENKEISLTFDTDTEELYMAVDSDMLERIILNLLSNSVKFTKPGGSIFVTLKQAEDYLYISVKDTGRGVPEDKLDKIFDRFIQVDKSLTRSSEGSGIGLSLVKALVELHNGSIRAVSSFGEGCEFIIKLPIVLTSSTEGACLKSASVNCNPVERINIEFSDIYS